MGLIVWSLSLSWGLRDEMRSPCFFGVTSKGDHLPIPRGIQVPVFSFTPTSPPAVRASPLRGCGLIPPACARSSAPFVSIHTLYWSSGLSTRITKQVMLLSYSLSQRLHVDILVKSSQGGGRILGGV